MASRLPSCMLLDEVGYIDDDIILGRAGDDDGGCGRGATSAEVRGMRISFFAADPPCLSYFRFHGQGPMKNLPLYGRPRILHSEANLALISVAFSMGGLENVKYFIYRVVGRGRRPSLEHLEHISDSLHQLPVVSSVGILPRPCDSSKPFDSFAVAALSLTGGNQYGLHVFLHKQGVWTCQVHLLEHDLVTKEVVTIDKVIVLPSGEIGFVDLWKGILVFDILQKKLLSRFIPLPKLLPSNRSDNQLGSSARSFRDVSISAGGLINCVEIESCWEPESPVDVWDNDVLHDSELVLYVDKKEETAELEEECGYHYLGWRVISWTRHLSSTCWHKKYCFRAQDITYPIPVGMEEFCQHALQPHDLHVSFPTLSMDSNMMYIFSKVETMAKECHVAVIDLGETAMSGFSMTMTERPLFNRSYVACDLFKYFDADLGELDLDAAKVENVGEVCFTSFGSKYPPPLYYECSASSCFCKPPLPQLVLPLPLQFKSNKKQEVGAFPNMKCQGVRFGTLDEKENKEQQVGTSPNMTSKALQFGTIVWKEKHIKEQVGSSSNMKFQGTAWCCQAVKDGYAVRASPTAAHLASEEDYTPISVLQTTSSSSTRQAPDQTTASSSTRQAPDQTTVSSSSAHKRGTRELHLINIGGEQGNMHEGMYNPSFPAVDKLTISQKGPLRAERRAVPSSHKATMTGSHSQVNR